MPTLRSSDFDPSDTDYFDTNGYDLDELDGSDLDCSDLDEHDLDEQVGPGGGDIEGQLDSLSEAIRPMLQGLPALLAAKERLDLPSDEGPDIGDIDRLFVYATETWQVVAVILEEIPPSAWPEEAVALQDVVAGVNATLQRPLEIELG